MDAPTTQTKRRSSRINLGCNGRDAQLDRLAEHTGGKGELTQQAHGEFIVSSETMCLPNAQWVLGGYF